MKNFTPISHDLILASIQEKNHVVLSLTQQLEQAREERDSMIYDAANDAQISNSRIARIMGTHPSNVKVILRRTEQKRQGLR